MNMKKYIKNLFAKNTYANNIFYDVFASGNERIMSSTVAETSRFDCIQSIDELRSFRSNITEGRVFSTKNANLSNARVYGIWRSLFPNYDETRVYLTPSVEHGLILHDRIFPDIMHSARVSSITMSSFRRDIIHKYLNVPVFCCGPYIQYANNWYEEEIHKEIKDSFGKTLLVFPCKSTDSSNLNTNNKKYLDIIRSYATEFDTVLINSFWWNVNDSLMFDFEHVGYKVVSAGFRDDPNFLRRLKTIISLSDFVLGDSVGTHIGYCIALNKPFCLVDAGTEEVLLSADELQDVDFRQSCIREIEEAFYWADSIGVKQLECASRYWGNDITLSTHELDLICDFTLRLVKDCIGSIKHVQGSALRIIESGRYSDSDVAFLLDSLR